MKPKSSQPDHTNLFSSRLEQILVRQHSLFVLAHQINWLVFDETFGSLYAEKGRPAKPTLHMERVNDDTMVQEKVIAYPTDTRFYHKAWVLLVKATWGRGIVLRQSYLRLGKRALIKSGRYAHARQMRRAKLNKRS